MKTTKPLEKLFKFNLKENERKFYYVAPFIATGHYCARYDRPEFAKCVAIVGEKAELLSITDHTLQRQGCNQFVLSDSIEGVIRSYTNKAFSESCPTIAFTEENPLRANVISSEAGTLLQVLQFNTHLTAVALHYASLLIGAAYVQQWSPKTSEYKKEEQGNFAVSTNPIYIYDHDKTLQAVIMPVRLRQTDLTPYAANFPLVTDLE